MFTNSRSSGVLVSLSIVHLLTGCAATPEGSKLRTISVWGHGEVRTPPDRFVLRAAVTHIDKDLDAARNRTAEAARTLLAAIRDFDPDEKETRTLEFAVDRRSNRDGDFIGFSARQVLEFTLTDVTQAEALTMTALKAGATEIRDADFETSQEAALFFEARKAALLDARSKAEAMAAVLGQRVGLPLRIGSDEDYYSGGDSIFGGDEDEAEFSWATPQEVAIEADVKVQFALHRK